MAKIIGNTTATPNPQADWNQTDETKADINKNKPNFSEDCLKYWMPDTEYFSGDIVVAPCSYKDEVYTAFLKCKTNHIAPSDPCILVDDVSFNENWELLEMSEVAARYDGKGNVIYDTYAT